MTDIDTFVNGYVDALSEDSTDPVPMATTDADEVIRSQLTENTGRHLLDSGSAYGRHWEENQDTPPWEDQAYTVRDSYVVHNVYDFLSQTCGRDDTAVALEIGLYAYGLHGPGEGDSWLTCMEGFADALGDPSILRDELAAMGLPVELADQVAYMPDCDGEHFTANTYNQEWHNLTQCIQVTGFGGPYAEYAAIQVHGGCDIRGGYTAPRVYANSYGSFIPHELSYYCEECEWHGAESVVGYDHEELIYLNHPTFPDLEDALQERGYETHAADIQHAVDVAHEDFGHIDGAVFHTCGDGRIGHVTF